MFLYNLIQFVDNFYTNITCSYITLQLFIYNYILHMLYTFSLNCVFFVKSCNVHEPVYVFYLSVLLSCRLVG